MLRVNLVEETPDVVLSLAGELDMMTGEVLKEAVDGLDLDRIRSLTFSLGGLSFIDSTGVGQLLGYYKRCVARKIWFHIENDNPDIEEILELIGIREVIKTQ